LATQNQRSGSIADPATTNSLPSSVPANPTVEICATSFHSLFYHELEVLDSARVAGAAAAEFATIWVWNWQAQDIKGVANTTSLQVKLPVPNSRLRTFWYFLYFFFGTSYKTLNCPSYSGTPPMIR